ncbi:hypothetical protein [Arthrobacter livingstonensis]|uniref:hypothetical protein n=1 Tax=Arthrobacter livingstonensis TaxID=670078 RepID=UPI0011B593E6|nr:hypothetical protein [Arthrobacter livingstonensis]
MARVTYLHLEFVGPRKLYPVAAVHMTGDQPESDVTSNLSNHRTASLPTVLVVLTETPTGLHRPIEPGWG